MKVDLLLTQSWWEQHCGR